MSSDSWKEVTNLQDNFTLSTATSGLGLTSLTFAPKKSVLTEDSANIIYFKVTLTIATASGEEHDRGRTSVIIPVNKNGIKVSLYKVNTNNGIASLGDEVCISGLYKMMCPAVQYQMLAAKVTSSRYDLTNTDFAWSLDGSPYNLPPGTENYFTGLDARTIIFPVTKNEQETQEITVTATPKSELQPVTGSRMITVVQPALFIKSDDKNISWPHTYSVESQVTKDAFDQVESPDLLEALANSNVSYRINFVPDYLLQNDPNVKIDWLLNGTSVHDISFYETNPLDGGTATLEDNDNVFKFPTATSEGVYYTLGATIKKFWSNDEINILSTVWGIAPQTLSADTNISVSTVLHKPSDVISQNSSQQILAAVGTHLPHYLMYNLRLALTILVMFFMSSVFYALSQKFSLNENK